MVRFLPFVLALALGQAIPEKPNFIIIFCDDLGYGDLGCYGHSSIRTPNLDRMAAEGQRWTDFYSAAEVCTPSRAAILTGRLPIRSGMASHKRRVLFPNSKGGLPAEEVTLAEVLKARGYATACVGKWHLGHLPPYHPSKHGFDITYGLPYSNDMKPTPLLRGEETIEEPAVQETLTRRYTEEALKFIHASKDKPFFLYFPHTFPHIPLFASDAFRGKSPRGLYGDAVEEIDWSVGEILKALRDEKLAERTLVVFSSDNGPWLTMNERGGSAGLLRDGKGSTFEGGMRVPGIFWWPGRVAPATIRDIGSTLDLLPTMIKLAGGQPPGDRPIDGFDLSPALLGRGPGPRQTMFFYRGTSLYAVRKGPWKAHFFTKSGYGRDPETAHERPLLYHLGYDPGEKYDVGEKHPAVIEEIRREAEAHRATVTPVENQLEK
jgi:arylsulfatase A-like enzyme